MALDLEKLKHIKLTKEQQQYLVVGVVLIAGLGYAYWNFGLKPLARQAVTLREELGKKEENLQKAKDMKRREVEYAERLQRVQLGQQYVARRLPLAAGFTDLAVRVNRIVTTGGMEMMSMVNEAGPNVKSEFEGMQKFMSTVSVVGDFKAVGTLLSRLSGEEAIQYAEDIQITPGDPTWPTGTFRCAIRLVIYSTLGVPR